MTKSDGLRKSFLFLDMFLILFLVLGQAVALPDNLINILAAVSGHDGIPPVEWNAMSFWERVKSHNWWVEATMIATILFYVSYHIYGARNNKRRVDRWMGAAKNVLDKQFAQVGVSPTQLLIKDSPTSYTTYASGRNNVHSLVVRFNLVDRQNLILSLASFAFPQMKSAEGLRDTVYMVFRPFTRTAFKPMTFSVVHKEVMQKCRDENFYLSLVKTTESNKLPNNLVFMSEHADITENIFVGKLKDAITSSSDILEMFAITDVPQSAPETVKDMAANPRIVLSMKFPSNAAEDQQVAVLLDAALNMMDVLPDLEPLSSYVTKKIRATREAITHRIEKAIEIRRKEEREMERLKAERAAMKEEERLSDKEQMRRERARQEKQAKRARQKMTKRV